MFFHYLGKNNFHMKVFEPRAKEIVYQVMDKLVNDAGTSYAKDFFCSFRTNVTQLMWVFLTAR